MAVNGISARHAQPTDQGHSKPKSHAGVPHDLDVLACSPTSPMPEFSWCRECLLPGVRAIVDVGGNIGEDVGGFLGKHENATVFTFEPTPHFFSILQQKYGTNPRVNITNTGASDKSGDAEFVMEGLHGEGTTGLDHTVQGEGVKVQLQDIDDILGKVTRKVGFVPDAVNINCEGCEYAVMQRIIDQGWLGKIRFLQLSWHTPAGVPDRLAKRCKIEQALMQSHDRVYHSYPGWVGWKLRLPMP